MWEQTDKNNFIMQLPLIIESVKKRSKAIKEIAEKLETTEEGVSRKMASIKPYYCQLKQS